MSGHSEMKAELRNNQSQKLKEEEAKKEVASSSKCSWRGHEDKMQERLVSKWQLLWLWILFLQRIISIDVYILKILNIV